jgi:hypothetical protein
MYHIFIFWFGLASEYERKQAKMKFFGRHCSMITDNVFLGGSLVARDKEKLKSKGVTYVPSYCLFVEKMGGCSMFGFACSGTC